LFSGFDILCNQLCEKQLIDQISCDQCAMNNQQNCYAQKLNIIISVDHFKLARCPGLISPAGAQRVTVYAAIAIYGPAAPPPALQGGAIRQRCSA